MTEVEKMLVVLGNSMATIANSMGSGKKETTEEKELEGSDGMLPGTRDLMGGRKRLKQVGAEHFMEERTVKRTRRAIMMDSKLPFAELYNEKLDELLVVEARKLECKHQLRELRGREATEKNVRQMEAKTVRMALIEEDCGSNDIKFRKFCRLVNSKGYQLTEDQVSTFMCGGRVEEERCTSCGEKTGWRGPRVGAGVTCA